MPEMQIEDVVLLHQLVRRTGKWDSSVAAAVWQSDLSDCLSGIAGISAGCRGSSG